MKINDSNVNPRTRDTFCESPVDYVATALFVTGIVLLILGVLVSKGFIPLSGTAVNYILGFGGGSFGVGALTLLLRGCCTR